MTSEENGHCVNTVCVSVGQRASPTRFCCNSINWLGIFFSDAFSRLKHFLSRFVNLVSAAVLSMVSGPRKCEGKAAKQIQSFIRFFRAFESHLAAVVKSDPDKLCDKSINAQSQG